MEILLALPVCIIPSNTINPSHTIKQVQLCRVWIIISNYPMGCASAEPLPKQIQDTTTANPSPPNEPEPPVSKISIGDHLEQQNQPQTVQAANIQIAVPSDMNSFPKKEPSYPIHPISEVPSAFEVDSRIHSANSGDINKNSDHFKKSDRIASQIDNEEEQAGGNGGETRGNGGSDGRMIELDKVGELVSIYKPQAGKARVSQRVHGEQQILEKYYERFEITIFQVALAAL